jgi:hypothetical protein
MDTLIIIAIIFFSVLAASIMVIHAITIRNLNSRILDLEKEEKRLTLENKELRDELHFHLNFVADLQKANDIYHKELKNVYLSITGYWLEKRRIIAADVKWQIDNKARKLSFEQMEEIAFDNYMRNLFK